MLATLHREREGRVRAHRIAAHFAVQVPDTDCLSPPDDCPVSPHLTRRGTQTLRSTNWLRSLALKTLWKSPNICLVSVAKGNHNAH